MHNTFFEYQLNLRQTSFQNAVLKFLTNSGTFGQQTTFFFLRLSGTYISYPFIHKRPELKYKIASKHFVFLRQLKVSRWYQKAEEISETSRAMPTNAA